MIHNEVIDTLLKRRSVRKYTGQVPDREVIETIVRAGQQAPFAYQGCRLVLTRKVEQETATEISLDAAALLGFLPGRGFLSQAPEAPHDET